MSCGLPLNGRAWVFVTSRSKMRRAESLTLRSSRGSSKLTGPEGNQCAVVRNLRHSPALYVRTVMLFMEGLMDPVAVIGLWTLALVGIGAVVSVARAEAHHQRKLGTDDD